MNNRRISSRTVFVLAAPALLLASCNLMNSLAGIPEVGATDRQARMEEAAPRIVSGVPVGGDAADGRLIFAERCTRCHGEDGRSENFGDDAEPEYVGTIANRDPLRFFEIANFGDADRWMPGFYDDLTLEQLIDVLAYAQTLPTR